MQRLKGGTLGGRAYSIYAAPHPPVGFSRKKRHCDPYARAAGTWGLPPSCSRASGSNTPRFDGLNANAFWPPRVFLGTRHSLIREGQESAALPFGRCLCSWEPVLGHQYDTRTGPALVGRGYPPSQPCCCISGDGFSFLHKLKQGRMSYQMGMGTLAGLLPTYLTAGSCHRKGRLCFYTDFNHIGKLAQS